VEAIKTFHTGVSEDFLLKEEKFKELRDRLLKSAADFYGRLSALLGRETDPASPRAPLASHLPLARPTPTGGGPEGALRARRPGRARRGAGGRGGAGGRAGRGSGGAGRRRAEPDGRRGSARADRPGQRRGSDLPRGRAPAGRPARGRSERRAGAGRPGRLPLA